MISNTLGVSSGFCISARIARSAPLGAIGDPPASRSPGRVAGRVYGTLGESGPARLLAWSALSDRATPPGASELQLLRMFGDAVYRRVGEEARAAGRRTPPRDEADF